MVLCTDTVYCLSCGICTTSGLKRAVCISFFSTSICLQMIGIISDNTDIERFLGWTSVFINVCIVLPTFATYAQF